MSCFVLLFCLHSLRLLVYSFRWQQHSSGFSVTATEEEAAEAYDIAAIKFRGTSAVTNFEMSRYDVEAIMKSPLPVGGASKRLKFSLESEQKPALSHEQPQQPGNASSNINFSTFQPISAIPCSIPYDAVSSLYHHNLFQHLQANAMATSNPSAASVTVPAPATMNILPPQAAEFFLWPHQSY